jgi:hypothetical protein
VAAWRKTLYVFAGYGRKTRFVPGHGPVCGIDIGRQRMDLMDDLEAQAEKMKRAGVPLEEAKRSYTTLNAIGNSRSSRADGRLELSSKATIAEPAANSVSGGRILQKKRRADGRRVRFRDNTTAARLG